MNFPMSDFCNLLSLTIFAFIFCSFSNGQLQLQYPDDNNFEDSLLDSTYGGSNSKPSMVEKALAKLKNSPTPMDGWPDTEIKFGQVSAVSVDKKNRLYVFHRASNVWDQQSFDYSNVYMMQDRPPIPEPTIIVLNSSGGIEEFFGQNKFYLPHGLVVDDDDNLWVTDVALHQVFRFPANDRKNPDLTLGTKFIPGNDGHHYCKPSAIAVSKNGEFFVADGYCNNRILKYDRNGIELLQWGHANIRVATVQPPYSFFVPHGLALAEDLGVLFVADRENGRLQSFHSSNGTFIHTYNHFLIGQRLFSVAYSPKNGGLLYVVNGLSSKVPVRGYVINQKSGKLIQQFGQQLSTPHDVAVSKDGQFVYVAELSPPRVVKFAEEIVEENTMAAKPTAVVDGGGVIIEASPTANSISAGGVAALGAALLVLATALFVARATRIGKRGVRRQQRWEYGGAEFKLQRLLGRARPFSRVETDDSDDDNTALTETNTNAANA